MGSEGLSEVGWSDVDDGAPWASGMRSQFAMGRPFSYRACTREGGIGINAR